MKRLNDDEIKSLPFEMQICYMLQGWNENIEPKTPKEWAEEVGFFNHKEKGVSNTDPIAIKKALNEAEYHINFVRKYILKN